MADGALEFKTDPETGDILYSEASPQSSGGAPPGSHFDNLASTLVRQDTLDRLSSLVTELVSFDEVSRSDWEDINAESIKLLGVGGESDADSDDPDAYADTSDHPLLLTAMTRFQSKALSAMLPSDDNLVRTKPAINLDDIDDLKERQATQQKIEEAGRRVQRFYTEYLQERCESYESDTDQILYECGLLGVGIRKIVKDTSNRRCPVEPIHVDQSDIIISYDAKSYRSGRITHRMNMRTPELIRKIRNGTFRPVRGLRDGDVPDKDPITAARDAMLGLAASYMEGSETHKLYEIQTELFLDSDPHPDGLARPYIVTVHARSQEVLRIVRNWEEGDETERPIEHYVAYFFHPGKSAVYGLGLGHLLSNITRALRKAQRRGLEAAYLQNHPSGFKLSNLSIRDDATRVRSGEFIDVDSPTNDIRSALMLHPFQGPSQGLMALADRLEQNGKELGGIASIDFASLMKTGIAAGPAMAAYEESTEFQTAVHRRLYTAHRNELRLLHDRMREVYGNRAVPFGNGETLRPGDLMMVDILPYMKPGQASKQKAMLEAQALWDLSGQAPDIIDRRAAAMDYLRALGKPNLDDYLLPDPGEDEVKPQDPISEYAMLLRGAPIKAGIAQNHQAHIDAHAAQMRLIANSQLPTENGDAALAVLASHIAEHEAMNLMVQAAARLGIDPNMLGENMDPRMEAQIAPMVAKVIAEIEAERAQMRNPEAGERMRIEEMKTERELEKQAREQAHEKELQRQRDEAAMARAIQDDETAIEIAAMPDRNRAPTRAGGLSG